MSFSVMTWNVENLFPPGTRISPQSKNLVSQGEFDAKLDRLAALIDAHRPSVLALQEIGGSTADDETAIAALQARLGCVYPHRLQSAHPDSRRIRVGLLSMQPMTDVVHLRQFPPGPLESVRTYADTPETEMGRGALSAVVEVQPGLRVRITTAHLKSKLLTFPSSSGSVRFSTSDEDERAFVAGIALFRRAAEAATLRAFVNQQLREFPDIPNIVLGDLNDEPMAATTQMLAGGTVDRDITSDDAGDAVRLYNLLDALPLRGPVSTHLVDAAERFTRVHEDRREILDHIFAAKSLVYRDGEFRAAVRIFTDQILPLEGSPNARDFVAASDHAPVMASFEI